MSALLSVAGVSKRFRGLVAVDNVSCDVMPGEIFAVIGPNGAGKTTLFATIAGALKADGGEISFLGERIDGLRPDEICRRGVARTFQVPRLFRRMTVLENLMVPALSDATARHAASEERAREVLSFLRLDHLAAGGGEIEHRHPLCGGGRVVRRSRGQGKTTRPERRPAHCSRRRSFV